MINTVYNEEKNHDLIQRVLLRIILSFLGPAHVTVMTNHHCFTNFYPDSTSDNNSKLVLEIPDFVASAAATSVILSTIYLLTSFFVTMYILTYDISRTIE
jgi:hypothetical protein